MSVDLTNNDDLTYSDVEGGSIVRVDRNEISLNNCHHVIVDLQFEHVVHRGVDEAEEILLAGLEVPHWASATSSVDSSILPV